MHSFSKPVRLLLAAVMAAVALSGLAGMVQSIRNDPMVWASLGFEVVILAAGLAGILYALGRTAHGRAIGLFNLGGVLLVSALTARFSWHTTVNPDALGVRASVLFAVKDPWFFSRGLLGLVLMVLAAVTVLRAEAVSWRRAVIGVVLAVPPVAAAGYVASTGTSRFFPSITNATTAFTMAFSILGTLALCVLFASGIHLVIKAFEQAGTNPGASGANTSGGSTGSTQSAGG